MTKLEKANAYQEKNRLAQEEKPVFHVTPPIGWMNDPNGFSVYQGKVHLFYQYHPYSDVWGPMHWGHYLSEDFVKWTELPVALAPDQTYDFAGCFSGSAIETEEGHVLLYTGVVEEEQADGSKSVYQNQCLAIGDGIHYKKVEGNPVVSGELLPEGFSREHFRDPKLWKEDGKYYMVAGNKNENQNGQIVLFESEDLRQWKYLSVLADNQGIYGTMWECPDFFVLDGSHVLVVSPQDMMADGMEFHNGNNSVCFIGEYHQEEHKLHSSQVMSLDYGLDYYAPQTLLTEDGRRILIAWMKSWDVDCRPENQRWNGMMTIPREMQIKEGILYQNPVRELEKYRTESVIYEHREISGRCSLAGIQGRVLDMTIELIEGDFREFTVHFAHNEKYTTRFTYFPAKQILEFDRTFSGLVRDVVCQRTMKIKHPKETVKLRLVLDKYSAELFVNDGAQTFSAAFYTPLEADDIIFECEGKVIVNIEKYKIQ